MRRFLVGTCLVLAACSGDRFESAATSGGGSSGAAGTTASGGSAGTGATGGATGGGGSGGSAGSAGSGGATGGAAGIGGTAGAGGAPCGGADLKTDAKNCGVCGHDCIESDCTQGECDGKKLIENAGPKGLAIGGDTLYFADANSNSIRRMASDGSGSATTFAANQPGATYVALADGIVYWTRTSGELMKQATGSSTAQQLTNYLQNPLGVAVFGQTAYIAEVGTARLLSEPVAGGAPTALKQMTPGGSIEGVATDGQKIWVGYNAGNALVVLPMTGASESPFATNQGGPAGVAVDTNTVYWANQGSGEIQKKAKASAAHSTLKTGVNHPVGVAVDDQFVYYAEDGAGRIVRIAK